MKISKSFFVPEESKSKIERLLWGQLIPEVLFTWKGLGLWPNTQSEDKNISEDDHSRKR